MTIVVVGAYTRDLFMYGSRLPSPGETVDCPDYAEAHGGKAANQAVAAARLGATTFIITGLGIDQTGIAAREMFAEEGVDTSFTVLNSDAATGVGFIIVDQTGHQLITTYAGASAKLTVADVERARPVLQTASSILLQGEIPIELTLVAMRLAGPDTLVILDPSPVEIFDAVAKLQGMDILTPNEPEARAIAGSNNPTSAEIAKLTNVPTVIITRGSSGAEVYYKGQTHIVPAPSVTAVDTTGAGDVFNGALAAGLEHGLKLLEAVDFACRCAAVSVQRHYCIPSFPKLNEVPWTKPQF